MVLLLQSRLSHPLAWLILLSCLTLLPCLCLFGISTLQCFHCYLLSTHQSTYSWIVRRRQLLAERQRQQQLRYHQAMQQHYAMQPMQPMQTMQPHIVLTDKQRAEQAEWLKQREANGALQQRQAMERQILSQEQGRPGNASAASPAAPSGSDSAPPTVAAEP
jgi:hypothetical protein